MSQGTTRVSLLPGPRSEVRILPSLVLLLVSGCTVSRRNAQGPTRELIVRPLTSSAAGDQYRTESAGTFTGRLQQPSPRGGSKHSGLSDVATPLGEEGACSVLIGM